MNLRECFGEIVLAAFVSAPLLSASVTSAATTRAKHDSGDEQSLRRFLQVTFAGEEESLKRSFANDPTRATHYVAAFRDLNGDGTTEAIVFLMGRAWCGSGGCSMLILARDGSAWKIVTQTTITRPPIRVLSNTSNGWHNIAVSVVGGGVRPGYEAELRFDGETYPTNPSVPPAVPLNERPKGEVVIPSISYLDGRQLYDDLPAASPADATP